MCKSSSFQFKQFAVSHDGCAMKVGTDGVLLGVLAPATGRQVLDIGTGSGLVALMLAQRMAEASITAVDIDSAATVQARQNFAASPWPERLKAIEADVRTYAPGCCYDLVVSNPPFYEHSPETRSASRDTARIAATLPFDALAATAARLLSDDGRFCVVLPAVVCERFSELCWLEGLHETARVDIVTKEGKPVKRCVATFSKKWEPKDVSTLILMTNDGQRSPAFQRLVAPFYIR